MKKQYIAVIKGKLTILYVDTLETAESAITSLFGDNLNLEVIQTKDYQKNILIEFEVPETVKEFILPTPTTIGEA